VAWIGEGVAGAGAVQGVADRVGDEVGRCFVQVVRRLFGSDVSAVGRQACQVTVEVVPYGPLAGARRVRVTRSTGKDDQRALAQGTLG